MKAKVNSKRRNPNTKFHQNILYLWILLFSTLLNAPEQQLSFASTHPCIIDEHWLCLSLKLIWKKKIEPVLYITRLENIQNFLIKDCHWGKKFVSITSWADIIHYQNNIWKNFDDSFLTKIFCRRFTHLCITLLTSTGSLAFAVNSRRGYGRHSNECNVRKHVITLLIGHTERELHSDSMQIPTPRH